MTMVRWIPSLVLLCSAAGCARHESGIASTSEAVTCVPQTLSCQRAPGLSKLKVKGSCASNADCSTLGPGGAVCTLQDPADPKSQVCIKDCADNDSCPFGSYCNDSGDCDYDCDGSPNSCRSGQTCNCNGQCEPTCETPPPTQVKPTLSLSRRK
jgi:hypothetical protein